MTATPSVSPTPKKRLLIGIVDSIGGSSLSSSSSLFSASVVQGVDQPRALNEVIGSALDVTKKGVMRAPLLRGGTINNAVLNERLGIAPSTDTFAR